jgi:hypothetical protein
MSGSDVGDMRAKINTTFDWAHLELQKRYLSFEIAIRSQGNAYVMAYNRFMDTLQAQKDMNNIWTQVGFGVLTAVSCGALSWLSTVLQSTSISKMPRLRIPGRDLGLVKIEELPDLRRSIGQLDFGSGRWDTSAFREILLNSAEDTLQVMVSEGIDTYQLMTAPMLRASETIPHPQIYQNRALNHLATAFRSHIEMLQNECDKLLRTRLERYKEGYAEWFDKKFRQYIAAHNIHAGLRPPVHIDEEAMARELEIGLWANWSVMKLHRMIPMPEYMRDPQTLSGWKVEPRFRKEYYGSTIGRRIENRLVELKIPALARIGEDFGWYTSEAEVRKLAQWGERWQPYCRFG